MIAKPLASSNIQVKNGFTVRICYDTVQHFSKINFCFFICDHYTINFPNMNPVIFILIDHNSGIFLPVFKTTVYGRIKPGRNNDTGLFSFLQNRLKTIREFYWVHEPIISVAPDISQASTGEGRRTAFPCLPAIIHL